MLMEHDKEESKLMTIREVCQELGVCRNTLIKLTRLGKFKQIRLPGIVAIRYRRSEVEAYLARGTRGRALPKGTFVTAGVRANP